MDPKITDRVRTMPEVGAIATKMAQQWWEVAVAIAPKPSEGDSWTTWEECSERDRMAATDALIHVITDPSSPAAEPILRGILWTKLTGEPAPHGLLMVRWLQGWALYNSLGRGVGIGNDLDDPFEAVMVALAEFTGGLHADFV